MSSSFTGLSTAAADVVLSDAGQIAFCDGTYYINIDIESDVEIYGQNGAGSVILDGANSGTVVDVQTDGLSVSVADVTIQNGAGDSVCISSFAGCGGGAGCSADSTTSLEIDTVTFTDNDADMGGALSVSESCSVTVRDSEMTANSADYGGGFWSDGGTTSVIDSDIHDNSTLGYGGGFAAYEYTNGVPLVELDGTMVYDNDAPFGGGAWLRYAETTCDGSTNDAGFTGNTSTRGGGALFLTGSTAAFDATACDFGTSAAGDDNSGFDIEHNGSPDFTHWAGDDATFSCESGRCGTTNTATLGGSGSSSDLTETLYGNYYTADTLATLDTVSFYVGNSGSCTADIYVMSNTSLGMTGWSVEFADTNNTVSSTGYLESTELGFPVEDGTYYVVAVGTLCTSTGLTVYWDYSASATDAGFGTADGYAYDLDYTSQLSVGDTHDFGGTVSTYGAIFLQQIGSIEL